MILYSVILPIACISRAPCRAIWAFDTTRRVLHNASWPTSDIDYLISGFEGQGVTNGAHSSKSSARLESREGILSSCRPAESHFTRCERHHFFFRRRLGGIEEGRQGRPRPRDH